MNGNRKQQDRHLDVPAEANRDKHVNFIAQESNETDPAREASTGPLAKNNNQRKKGNKQEIKERRH